MLRGRKILGLGNWGRIYCGNQGKLFKRDFAGEIMDRYPMLNLVDYGFQYHRDNHFPQNNTTCFLMENR